MFTNEFESDATVTTILDETAAHEDVRVYIEDNGVFISQYNETLDKNDLIVMTHQMFYELMAAMKTTEGVYRTYFNWEE
jgi:hypothetical protein